MDRRHLMKLRIFELFCIIIVSLILAVLLTITLWYYHSSVVVLRIFVLIGLLSAIRETFPSYKWSLYKTIPWLRELREYEHGRWKRTLKFQTTNKTFIMISVVLVVIAFVIPMEQDPRPMTLFLGDWISLLCWLLVMVIVSWVINKMKVDADEGNKRTVSIWSFYILGFVSLFIFLYLRNSFEDVVAHFMR